MRSEIWRHAIAAGAVIGLFIIASWAVAAYETEIASLAGLQGAAGMAAYVGLTIAAVVVAPVSTFPLIPVAVALWGPLPAAVLSVVGWTSGAWIAFWISRVWGQPLVERIVSLSAVRRIERAIPDRHLFAGVVLLRMALPVDVLSYALGLFTSMPTGSYVLATFLGVIPFAFVFSYMAVWPLWWQAGAGALAMVVLFGGYTTYMKRHRAESS